MIFGLDSTLSCLHPKLADMTHNRLAPAFHLFDEKESYNQIINFTPRYPTRLDKRNNSLPNRLFPLL